MCTIGTHVANKIIKKNLIAIKKDIGQHIFLPHQDFEKKNINLKKYRYQLWCDKLIGTSITCPNPINP